MKNQRGFTAVEGVLAVLLLAAIGAAGYFAYHSRSTAASNTTSTPAASQQSAKASTPADGNAYTDVDGYFTLQYPTAWKVSTDTKMPSAGYLNPLTQHRTILGPNGDAVVSVYVKDASKDSTGSGISDFASFEKVYRSDVAAANNEQVTDLTIGGQPAFEAIHTNGSQLNTYYISKSTTVIQLTMNVKSDPADPTAVDNSQYVSQFDTIAKSVKIVK